MSQIVVQSPLRSFGTTITFMLGSSWWKGKRWLLFFGRIGKVTGLSNAIAGKAMMVWFLKGLWLELDMEPMALTILFPLTPTSRPARFGLYMLAAQACTLKLTVEKAGMT